MAGSEQRKNQRFNVVMEVKYQNPPGLEADYVTDLGAGGLFISTTEVFEVGQRLDFRIDLPQMSQAIDLEGIVRWRKEPSYEGMAGIGVELVYPDDEVRRQVAGVLERVKSRLLLQQARS